MAINSVQNNIVLNQEVSNSMDGVNMHRQAFKTFLDDLIRSNCNYKDGCYLLFASDLADDDKKIFLSYLLDADDYRDALTSPTRFQAYLHEYEHDMQLLINDRIDDIWHEDMHEMGLVLAHHVDNNESYYFRK